MKREAMGHTKMKKLKRYLKCDKYVAVGILESLWHLTAREAPRGDIGRLPNEDIAIGIDYSGDPEVLIDALLHAEWLDRSDEHRLIVHDWSEHADDTTQAKLARASLLFADGKQPKLGKLSKTEREECQKKYAECAHKEFSGIPKNSEGSQRQPTAANGTLPEPEPLPVPDITPTHTPRETAKTDTPEAPSVTPITVKPKGMDQLLREDLGKITFESMLAKFKEYGIQCGPDDLVIARTMWDRRDDALRQKIYDSVVARIEACDFGYTGSSIQKYIDNHFARAIRKPSTPSLPFAKVARVGATLEDLEGL